MISIMNGVHCQTSTIAIDNVGYRDTHSTDEKPSCSISQLRVPYSPWKIWFFQISPTTTGISRNGVMISVRTTP